MTFFSKLRKYFRKAAKIDEQIVNVNPFDEIFSIV